MADHRRKSKEYLQLYVKQVDTVFKSIVQFSVQWEQVWLFYASSFQDGFSPNLEM